jgi:hypothetical protein
MAAFTETPICLVVLSEPSKHALRFRHETDKNIFSATISSALHQRSFQFLHELRSRKQRSQTREESVHTKDYSLSSVKLIFNFAIDFFRLPCAAKGIAASPSVAGHLIIKVLDRGKQPTRCRKSNCVESSGIPS